MTEKQILTEEERSVPISDPETKNGNYLLLNKAEVEAIKAYTGSDSVWMNALFTTNVSDVLKRLKHRARSDKVVEQRFSEEIIEMIVDLYSALLKAHRFHQSSEDYQDHPSRLYRGISGYNHSSGFKSFSTKRAMAESFGDKIFEIEFPKDIPFLSPQDIYNYAPYTSRREEDEYLFSPFCEIVSDKSSLLSRRKRWGEKLVLREIKRSGNNLPTDVAENLRIMAELITEYNENLLELERFVRWSDYESSQYQAAVARGTKIEEYYRFLSEQIVNYIEQRCGLLHEELG